jgi:serine O-acetyltransferase
MNRFKTTLIEIKNDLPKRGLINFIKALIFNPSFKLLLLFRIGKYLSQSKIIFLRLIAVRIRIKIIKSFGCDFSFKATIGRKCKFAHPIGIVIGSEVIIEDNVTIFQNVTFGSHGKKKKEKNYPIIKNNVTIYANSVIIGDVTIEENAIIGASTLVNKNVPKNSTAFGNPMITKYNQ